MKKKKMHKKDFLKKRDNIKILWIFGIYVVKIRSMSEKKLLKSFGRG